MLLYNFSAAFSGFHRLGKKFASENEDVFVDARDVTRKVGHLLMASCRPEEVANKEVMENWP